MYLILVLRVLNTPVNNNQLNNLDSNKMDHPRENWAIS